ncbi:hypothetical protein [Anaerococcus hydrogenalis]|uniref:Chloramphenicol resistance protein n=1 Tax=Anaerococcus hydrogenalis ACS-025-V-Sch4 TaxID=879306 RepID=F0H2B7_9FIRM|nr:hypothetical protein [Anaerococcus hydrogenalis]EGC83438.1 hypothetical protein HMPREF9246_0277 [Anaerococcus hydrogenalis ACS-025-V-Sch4]
MKSIIESVREYFLKCPYLEDDVRLSVDFLGDQPLEYGIYTEPISPTIKKYVDGDELKQFGFIFTTRSHMSGDLVTQLENSAFFDNLIEWIQEMNYKKEFPELEGDKYPTKLEIITNGYLSSADVGSSQYQIQMRLVYMEVNNG